MRSLLLLTAVATFLLSAPTPSFARDDAAAQTKADQRTDKRLIAAAERAARKDRFSESALAAWQAAAASPSSAVSARCALEIGWIQEERGDLQAAEASFTTAAYGAGPDGETIAAQGRAELRRLEDQWLKKARDLGQALEADAAREAFGRAEACAGGDPQRVLLERGYFEQEIDPESALSFFRGAAEGGDAKLAERAKAMMAGIEEALEATRLAAAAAAVPPTLEELLAAAEATEAELPTDAPDPEMEGSLLDAAEAKKRTEQYGYATLEAWRAGHGAAGAAGRQRAALEIGWIHKVARRLHEAESYFLAAAVGPAKRPRQAATEELAVLGQLWTVEGAQRAKHGDLEDSAEAFAHAISLGGDEQLIDLERGYSLSERDPAAARAALERAAAGPDPKRARQAKEQLDSMPAP